MTKSLNRPKEHIPLLRQLDGSWAKKSFEKAELFAKFLTDSFKPNEPDIDCTEVVNQ
jgi:hypothetical protein